MQALGIALATLVASTAHADEGSKKRGVPILESGTVLNDGPTMEFGGQLIGGKSEYSQLAAGLDPSAQGLFIHDHNGMTSRMVIGLVIAIAGAAAASGPKSQTSESHVEGDYLVTTTTTTYYTEEEKEQMRQNTNAAVDGLFKAKNSDFELDLYSRDRFGYGDCSGYKTNFMVGDGKKVVFQTGFGFGQVDCDMTVNGHLSHLSRGYLGMPFRVGIPMGKARMVLTWEWDWSSIGKKGADNAPTENMDGSTSYDIRHHPWRLDLQAAVLGRVALTAGLTMPALKHPSFGYAFALAGRF